MFHETLQQTLLLNLVLFVTSKGHFSNGAKGVAKADELVRTKTLAVDVIRRKENGVHENKNDIAQFFSVGPALTYDAPKRPKNSTRPH